MFVLIPKHFLCFRYLLSSFFLWFFPKNIACMLPSPCLFVIDLSDGLATGKKREKELQEMWPAGCKLDITRQKLCKKLFESAFQGTDLIPHGLMTCAIFLPRFVSYHWNVVVCCVVCCLMVWCFGPVLFLRNPSDGNASKNWKCKIEQPRGATICLGFHVWQCLFCYVFLNQVPWLLVSRLFDIFLCFAGGHSVVLWWTYDLNKICWLPVSVKEWNQSNMSAAQDSDYATVILL